MFDLIRYSKRIYLAKQATKSDDDAYKISPMLKDGCYVRQLVAAKDCTVIAADLNMAALAGKRLLGVDIEFLDKIIDTQVVQFFAPHDVKPAECDAIKKAADRLHTNVKKTPLADLLRVVTLHRSDRVSEFNFNVKSAKVDSGRVYDVHISMPALNDFKYLYKQLAAACAVVLWKEFDAQGRSAFVFAYHEQIQIKDFKSDVIAEVRKRFEHAQCSVKTFTSENDDDDCVALNAILAHIRRVHHIGIREIADMVSEKGTKVLDALWPKRVELGNPREALPEYARKSPMHYFVSRYVTHLHGGKVDAKSIEAAVSTVGRKEAKKASAKDDALDEVAAKRKSILQAIKSKAGKKKAA